MAADQPTQDIEQVEPGAETVPASATTEQEAREWRTAHDADRPPTPEEEEAAESHGPPDAEVVAHARDMARRGAEVKGEGEVR